MIIQDIKTQVDIRVMEYWLMSISLWVGGHILGSADANVEVDDGYSGNVLSSDIGGNVGSPHSQHTPAHGRVNVCGSSYCHVCFSTFCYGKYSIIIRPIYE